MIGYRRGRSGHRDHSGCCRRGGCGGRGHRTLGATNRFFISNALNMALLCDAGSTLVLRFLHISGTGLGRVSNGRRSAAQQRAAASACADLCKCHTNRHNLLFPFCPPRRDPPCGNVSNSCLSDAIGMKACRPARPLTVFEAPSDAKQGLSEGLAFLLSRIGSRFGAYISKIERFPRRDHWVRAICDEVTNRIRLATTWRLCGFGPPLIAPLQGRDSVFARD